MTSFEVIAKALKDSELDCNQWSEAIRIELAKEIIAALQKADYQLYEYNPR